jgi:phosphoglycerate-specific signal transduction histidine kinase
MAIAGPRGFRSNTGIMNELSLLFDITLEDIKSNWIDLMVKRLFSELNRQMCQAEAQKADGMMPGDRTENARVLASLQNTMEKLVRMEAQRDARRKGKNVTKDADARKTLERKLNKLASARAAQKPR